MPEQVDQWIVLGRILLAALLGFLIGMERERHGRAAGLRTCILVATAGALLMTLSLHLAQLFAPAGEASAFRLDPGRLPSYAIAGMGFLGAGAIIQGRSTAVGITTAAALWTSTGAGLAVGAGLYLPAFVTVAVALVALVLLPKVSHRLHQEQYVTLKVDCHDPAAQNGIRSLLNEYGVLVRFVGRERCLDSGNVTYNYDLTIHAGNQWSNMLDRLEGVPGVSCYTWSEYRVP